MYVLNNNISQSNNKWKLWNKNQMMYILYFINIYFEQ